MTVLNFMAIKYCPLCNHAMPLARLKTFKLKQGIQQHSGLLCVAGTGTSLIQRTSAAVNTKMSSPHTTPTFFVISA